ncbi:hypothetical protein O6H91_10G050700 [Diphasiastrum complanatum]|uniref:Uncharacterized protein n=1 Tax=Diphasiastrum complanatum TaxID=34168 RepID=A0ACC2CHU7_DIPCM|nr:hypothetical protein O6H91_10G050700 [Diphasiastrum complanatum]
MPNPFEVSILSLHFQLSSRVQLPIHVTSTGHLCTIAWACTSQRRLLSCAENIIQENALTRFVPFGRLRKFVSAQVASRGLSCHNFALNHLDIYSVRALRSLNKPLCFNQKVFIHGKHKFVGAGGCSWFHIVASLAKQDKVQCSTCVPDFAHDTGVVKLELSREQSDFGSSDMPAADPLVKVKVMGLGARAATIINFCMESRLLPFAEFWLNKSGSSTLQFSQLQHTTSSCDIDYDGTCASEICGIASSESQQALGCKDMTIIVVGAGGTNGLEVASELLKAAHSEGGLAVAIVTQPFEFEGRKRVLQVQEMIHSLHRCTDLLFVIESNALLKKGNVTLEEASKIANKAILFAIKAIYEVLSILRYAGMAQVGYGSAPDAKAAVTQAILNSPFLNGLVSGVKAFVLCTLSCAEVISTKDQQLALGYLRHLLGSKAELFSTWIEDTTLLKGCTLATIIVLRLESKSCSKVDVASAESCSQAMWNGSFHKGPTVTADCIVTSCKEVSAMDEIALRYQVSKANISCSGNVQDESSHMGYDLEDKQSMFDIEQRGSVNLLSNIGKSHYRKLELGKVQEDNELGNSPGDSAHQSDAMIRNIDSVTGVTSSNDPSVPSITNDNEVAVDNCINHKHRALGKRKLLSEMTSIRTGVSRDGNIKEKRVESSYLHSRATLTGATENSIMNEKVTTVRSDKDLESANVLSQNVDESPKIASSSGMGDLGFISWDNGPGSALAEAWAKARAVVKEESSILGGCNGASMPIGVRPREELKNEAYTCLSEEVSKLAPQPFPIDPAAIPRSSVVEIGLGAVADIYRAASALVLGRDVEDNPKESSVSKRAASMLEQERGHGILTPVSETNYKNGFYKGRCESGVPDGKGRITYADGSFYDGHWKEGKRLGFGSFYYANGDMYQGSWKDDHMHGQGWLYFHTGDRFHATYRRGKANGEGRLYSAGGDVFFGQFRDNWRHGESLHIESTGVRWYEVWDYGALLSRKLIEDFQIPG